MIKYKLSCKECFKNFDSWFSTSREFDKLKKNVIAGYNLTCLGDDHNYSFLPSKYKNSLSDKAARKAFNKLKVKYKKRFTYLYCL